MKRRLIGALAAVVLGVGCGPGAQQAGTSASGSLGLTQDDTLLYAADADRDAVYVIDTKTDAVVREVKVGDQPEKVLVAPDDTVFVTNRMSRSVSVLRPGEATEAARIEVGVEPVGLALSMDRKTLYVVSAASRTDTEVGTLTAVDARTLAVLWELPVGHEPRAIALLPGNKAAISLYKAGELVLVDLATKQVQPTGQELFEQLNRSALGISSGPSSQNDLDVAPKGFGGASGFGGTMAPTFRARGIEAMVVSADGQQVFATGRLASDGLLNVRPQDPSTQVNGTRPPDSSLAPPGEVGGGSVGYGGGSCGGGSAAAPALLTFDSAARPQVDDVQSCVSGSVDRPPMALRSGLSSVPVQGPGALAVDPSGRFLFIANQESNNVSIVATTSPGGGLAKGNIEPSLASARLGTPVADGSQQVVNVGAGPTGVVVSHDGQRAWVLNAFDHSVSRLEASTGGRLSNVATTKFADDVLPPDVVLGRKLFFSAVDPRMNDPRTGIACASCHLEGREDGHVWHFPDGPRQTPSLAGRHVIETAPLHWNGEFNNLLEFMTHTVKERMGGVAPTPDMERQMAAYILQTRPADNALAETTPPAVIARGKAVYEKAQCASCHQGQAYTDNQFYDVGTYVRVGGVVDNMKYLPRGLNTPSLLGLGRTAPYLHDGSAVTLKERILEGKQADRHGATAQLSNAEVDDLVAYLKTL